MRIWGLGLLAAAIWLLSVFGQSRPDALGLDAPVTAFSAARADAVLGRVLGDQAPHPAGSAAAEAVRTRILKELTAMGVHADTQTGMSCYSQKRWDNIPCGTVTNIIAGVSPGAGKEILLMAHSDSVAAGPGAGDDGAGVAILLESVRALKARGIEGGGKHPVIAVFTDGEEPGMVGASLYLRDSLRRAQVGAIVNVEARGNQGPSYLFQTSAGNGKLIELYGQHVKQYATSSLYGEIYKYMPNDTDLTPMLATGALAYNFAFVGNVAQYHTPLDRRENIDPRSLQQQGDAALELTEALSHAELASLHGPDAIYLDVLGRWLPRLSTVWALPLSITAFAVIALAGLLMRRGRRDLPPPVLPALLSPVLLVAGAAGMGFVLHGLAAWIGSQPDPSYAHPAWLRLSLGLGVFAVALLAARGAAAIACWLWFAALAIACSVFAPGLTPYFLFPSLVAAPLLLMTVHGGRGFALMVSALAALIVWIGLAASGEITMGLKTHALFTVSAAFGLLALLPLLGKAKGWGWAFAASLLLALGLSVAAGLQPAFSPAAPQRLNLHYAEIDGKAAWLADPVTQLPDSLRKAANFSARPQLFFEEGYVATAGAARNAAPTAVVTRRGDEVMLDLNADADAIMLVVPAKARLQALTIGDVTLPVSERRILIDCVTSDCGHAHMTLRLGSPEAANLFLVVRRRGLPADGAKLLRARPADATATHGGDSTLLAAKIAIPAR
ncbi:MAG: M28 family peptidase [Alphaproteobacteria bacterium]|nr:M28 family peptidase [Alphaproteobacteria bacterium]